MARFPGGCSNGASLSLGWPVGNAGTWEIRMRLKQALVAVVVLLLIASLASWMFAEEDPPADGGPPPLEAGQ